MSLHQPQIEIISYNIRTPAHVKEELIATGAKKGSRLAVSDSLSIVRPEYVDTFSAGVLHVVRGVAESMIDKRQEARRIGGFVLERLDIDIWPQMPEVPSDRLSTMVERTVAFIPLLRMPTTAPEQQMVSAIHVRLIDSANHALTNLQSPFRLEPIPTDLPRYS